MAEPILTKSGVYQIKNLVNGKSYVGSSSDIANRWRQHRFDLKNRNHDNSYLQRAWDKYGVEAFEFSVLEIVEKDAHRLIEREQFWIDAIDAANVGYNLRTTANSNLGMKYSEQARANMSAAQKGKRQSPETIAKRSAAKTGVKLGPQSEEHKAKLSAIRRGKKPSSETLAKRAEAMRKLWSDPAYKEMMSAKRVGAKRSTEARERMKIAAAKPEYRAKLSAAITAHWETRRERSLLNTQPLENGSHGESQ